jgi:hypothetical protein
MRVVGLAMGLVLTMVALAMVVVILLVVQLVTQVAQPGGFVGLRQSKTVQPSGPVVVDRVQSLGRLETSRHMLHRVIESHSMPVLAIGGSTIPLRPFQDCVVLVAHGEVVAGVDLRQISAHDVTVGGDTLTLRLPPAEILLTRLDNDASHVAYRCQPPLNLGRNDALEGETRAAAEQALREAALADGALGTAATNARELLTPFLRSLGFREVRYAS